MLRPGFTAKLIIGLMLAIALVVTAMGLSSRWSFEQGFIRYLAQTDAKEAAPLIRELAAFYDRTHDWSYLHMQPQLWQRMVGGLFQGQPAGADGNLHPPRPFAPPPRFGPGWQRPPGLAHPVLDDATGLHSRMRLLDRDHKRVIGPPDRAHDGRLLPIDSDGKTVGWLSISPPPLARGDLGAAFRDQQLRSLIWIGLAALLLAPLLALALGRFLLRPLRSLTGATHELAAGHYHIRVPVTADDELGRLARDFNQLAETLQRNEKLRREAMTDVSHELRTPLSLLRAEIEALQDGVRRCDQQRLGSLHQTVQGLSRLVEDLFELTLADAGALTYRREPCDLGPLLKDAAEAAREAMNHRRLTLELAVRGPLPVSADPRRLRQLFDNLLKNSLRYTEAGGRAVLRAHHVGKIIVVELFDSAPGVAAEELPRLFERFYRVEKSRNRDRGGAGLGLAIVRSIVEAHGGRIEARPSPLDGLLIHIELPAFAAGRDSRDSRDSHTGHDVRNDDPAATVDNRTPPDESAETHK